MSLKIHNQYVNYYQNNSLLNAPKILGRDFEVLTAEGNGFIDRWIFPKEFTDSLKKNSDKTSGWVIGPSIRHTSRFSEKDREEITAPKVEKQSPFRCVCNMDKDAIYTLQKMSEDIAFRKDFEDTTKEGSTEITYDNANKKFIISLKVGNSTARFEVVRENYWCYWNNLLDGMLEPPAE